MKLQHGQKRFIGKRFTVTKSPNPYVGDHVYGWHVYELIRECPGISRTELQRRCRVREKELEWRRGAMSEVFRHLARMLDVHQCLRMEDYDGPS